jgi:hypothetical protein
MTIAGNNRQYQAIWVPENCNWIGLDVMYDGTGILYIMNRSLATNRTRMYLVAGEDQAAGTTGPIQDNWYHLSRSQSDSSRMETIPGTADIDRLVNVVDNQQNELELQIATTGNLRLWAWRWFLMIGWGWDLVDGAAERSTYPSPNPLYPIIPDEQILEGWVTTQMRNGQLCRADFPQALLKRLYALSAGRIRFTPWTAGSWVDDTCTSVIP